MRCYRLHVGRQHIITNEDAAESELPPKYYPDGDGTKVEFIWARMSKKVAFGMVYMELESQEDST
jgi:hypothetical protein